MTRIRRIATEEAFSIPQVAEALREVVRGPSQSLDRLLCAGIYDAESDTTGYARMSFLDGLLDIEGERLRQMDEFGVDVQLLSLTAPGVQMFDADTATDLAALANDYLADVCARRPDRFAGLASFAPHSPKRAAREMERAITELKLNGFMVNSHTYGEYLDDPKFWPILETAEALDRVLYIHPRAASNTLKGPLQDYGMDSAMWGYGVEVGTHVVRMMAGGVFDRFPKLKVCIGHMGEAIPFWIWRIAFMNKRAQEIGLARKTELTMDEYFQRNFPDHHQRGRGSSGAPVLDRQAGRRQRHVGDRLSLSAHATGGRIHGCGPARSRRDGQSLPPKRGAGVPHCARPGRLIPPLRRAERYDKKWGDV